MRNPDVTKWNAAVVGAGTMGLCIAQCFAMHGHKVNLYNRTPENLTKAVQKIKDNLNALIELDMITPEGIESAMALINPTSDLKVAMTDVDYAIESVAENRDVKLKVFTDMAAFGAPDTILASDTSSMNIFEFLGDLPNQERIIIDHFFNPAYVMPLVEQVLGPNTSQEVSMQAKAFLEDCGKDVAVLNKMAMGFIINRLSTALMREIGYMADTGVASLEDIDKAIVATYGPRFTFEGPVKMGDFIGVDILSGVTNLIAPDLCNSDHTSETFANLVKEGKLGVKSGEGIYGKYPDPVKAVTERNNTIIKMTKAIADVLKNK